jgi:hypothetical protein
VRLVDAQEWWLFQRMQMNRNAWTVFTVAAAALGLFGAGLLLLSIGWGFGARGAVLPLLLVLIGALFARAGLHARRNGAPARELWSPALSAVLLACVWEVLLITRVVH